MEDTNQIFEIVEVPNPGLPSGDIQRYKIEAGRNTYEIQLDPMTGDWVVMSEDRRPIQGEWMLTKEDAIKFVLEDALIVDDASYSRASDHTSA